MYLSIPKQLSVACTFRSIGAGARDEIQYHRHTYLLIFVLFTLTFANAVVRGEEFSPFIASYAARAWSAVVIAICATAVFLALRALIRNEGSPVTTIASDIREMVEHKCLTKAFLGIATFVFFMAAFLFNKMLIPLYSPFEWDAALSQFDRLVFGGRYPWEIMQPVLGYPPVTRFLDVVYSAWVPLMPIFWIGMAVSRRVPAQLRRQYWFTTVLLWISVGLLLAFVFSSAGPCYFPLLVRGVEDPYAGLNAYLGSVNGEYGLSSSLMKDYLWAIHSGEFQGVGGISAMPSMHNAQAALFSVAAYRINRWFGHTMTAYAILICIGSVHLAWHYAVDAIAGVSAALVIWWMVGIITAKYEATPLRKKPMMSESKLFSHPSPTEDEA